MDPLRQAEIFLMKSKQFFKNHISYIFGPRLLFEIIIAQGSTAKVLLMTSLYFWVCIQQGPWDQQVLGSSQPPNTNPQTQKAIFT